jgi:AcrR family transcriptional regulator
MTRKLQARTLATRDRLLTAGREIVAASGMAGLRTEEVVLRAGVAKGTFFAHFTDRDQFLAALLAALLAEGLSDDFADLAVPVDRAALTRVLNRLFTAFAAEPDRVALLARYSGLAGAGLGLDRLICQIVERLAAGLAGLQARGLVANPAAPGVLAEALLAMVFHAAASAQCPVHGDPVEVRARAETLLEAMTTALLGA